MIRVFGAPPNRTHRVLWMLEEGGLEYELVRLQTAEEIAASAELAHLNPNRRVPTLVDGDVVVWDSLAINLYLSERYRVLHPGSIAGFAYAIQWSIWAQTDVDANLLTILKGRRGSESERDPVAADRAEDTLRSRWAVLESALAEREHLLGADFTVADLNVASILIWAKMARLDLSACPDLKRWLDACLARPAYQRLRAARS